MGGNGRTEQHGETARVSTIELFFDLVFVFTITRVTELVEHAYGALDYLRALLVLTLIWWMYAGYAWLTNGAGTERRMRPVLLAAMPAFLVLAIAVPDVFHGSAVAFGLAYLFIVLLHLGAFYRLGGPGIGPAVRRLAPFNVGAALLALGAGLIHASWSWVLFVGAVAVLTIATLRHSERGFPIHAPHFVERHGLILIIALGETVIAVGAGAAERALDARSLTAILLAVALLAALWWSYFDRDDAGAEGALLARSADERALVAIRAFWTPYLAMICGIVLVAAGLKQAAAGPRWLLAAGLAVYLGGSALFRAAVGIRPVGARLLAAAVALAVVPIGAPWGGSAELAALTILMYALLVFERAPRAEHARRPAFEQNRGS